MADNSQAIAQALAEAEQRVQQLRAQLQQAQSSNPVAAKYAQQKTDYSGLVDHPGAGIDPRNMAWAQAQDAKGRAAMAANPTLRMAHAMGAEAQQGQAFVDQDRMLNQGNGDRTRQLLRMKMQQLANPGMSPMQMDLQRRMPPTVSPQAAAQWQQAQAGTPAEDWNDPWKYSGG
jgi:hypothetical protein